MPVNFKEITTEAEFSRVIDCMWPAYSNPYIPFLQILFPVFSPTAEGYQAAVDGSKIGMWTTHSSDPSSHWVAVVDSDTGEVFAGAHWNFHKVSPFLNGAPTLIAMWHPEGESREFASRMLNQVYGGRGSKMWRPYAQLDMMFTSPKERRKGYGSMLMKYGMDIAEEMGVEVLVEASIDGLHLYKKFGLRTIEKICLDATVDDPSPLWKKLEYEFGDMFMWWMWKPVHGTYEAGKTELPWLAKPN